MDKRDWVAERWLLRFVQACGFVVAGDETFEAAVRAGAARDLVSAAEAFDVLRRLQLLSLSGPVAVLTREGERAAETASRFARNLGEPGLALPESRLPTIVMAEADYETVDTAAETAMLQPPHEEKRMKDVLSPATQRFSLDDPDAGRKLVENLDRRKVRLAFSELCWHFRCDDYDDKMRLRAFLLDLSLTGDVVEVLPNLYCRPALRGGASDAASVSAAVSELKRLAKPKKRRRSGKDAGLRDAQADALRAFITARGGTVKRAEIFEEARRLGWPLGRADYVIQHLRASGAMVSNGYGKYRLRDDAPSAPEAATGTDPSDDA